MNNQQIKTVVLGRIIQSMFMSYTPTEKTKLHKQIEIRLAKGLKRQNKKHGSEAIREAVILGKKVWFAAIDHYDGEELKIEASNMVLRILDKDEKNLSKIYGLNKGIVGKWANPLRRPDAAEIEANTGKIVDYLMKDLNSKLGITEEKKPSVLDAIRWAKVKRKQHQRKKNNRGMTFEEEQEEAENIKHYNQGEEI